MGRGTPAAHFDAAPDRLADDRWPALDGLRALAVAAVVLFHLDRLPGGNLGVDAFFVLSGWLITVRLLRQSARPEDGVDLPAFWVARIRRLVPASLLLIVSVVAVWSLAHIVVPTLRHDALWALGWSSNWGTILSGGDYWARFGEPSPLTHLWSLAVEEQFYLLWPLLLAVLLRPGARHRGATVTLTAGALAIASVVWMVVSFDPVSPTATYVDTMARAHSLLVGAALAGWTCSRSGRQRLARAARTALPVAVVVLLGIVAFATASSTWLFRWGFPAFALAMGVVVVAAADGAGASVLARRPLRWVGERSFGIYLWHWPVILLLARGRAPVDGVWLDGLRVAVAVALAAASYHWLEMPIRQRRVIVRRAPAVGGLAFAGALAAVLLIGTTTAVDRPPSEPSTVALAPAAPAPATATAATGSDSTSLSSLPTDLSAVQLVAHHESRTGPLRVLVAGDSTAVQLARGLLPYAAAHPDELVAGSAAFPGCGLTAATDGRMHEQYNPDGSTSLVDLRGCMHQWTTIPDRVAAEQVEVVLVDIGAWDAADIHLPDGRVVSVGDAAGRELLAAAYGTFVANVEAAGAQVIWITPPDAHLQWGAVDMALNDPVRWEAMRAVLDDLHIEQIDLHAWLTARKMTGPEGRPDGVHLADPVNETFVANVVAPHLANLTG